MVYEVISPFWLYTSLFTYSSICNAVKASVAAADVEVVMSPAANDLSHLLFAGVLEDEQAAVDGIAHSPHNNNFLLGKPRWNRYIQSGASIDVQQCIGQIEATSTAPFLRCRQVVCSIWCPLLCDIWYIGVLQNIISCCRCLQVERTLRLKHPFL